MTTVPRLGHVILYVSDLDVSVRFYRDVAGLPHRFTDAGYAEFETGATRLAVYERRRAEWLIGHPVHPGPAGEIVLVVDDLDAVAAALRDRGVPLLSEPADRPWGHRTLHVAVELHRRVQVGHVEDHVAQPRHGRHGAPGGADAAPRCRDGVVTCTS